MSFPNCRKAALVNQKYVKKDKRSDATKKDDKGQWKTVDF